MCLFRGDVDFRSHKYPVRILLDSGADRQYVSQKLVNRIGLDVEPLEFGGEWVQTATGTYAQMPGEANFTLFLGEYRSRVQARVLNMPEFDIILGLAWLREVNPHINWRTLQVEVTDIEGNTHQVEHIRTSHYIQNELVACLCEELQPLTASQVGKLIRQPGTEGILFAIREVPEKLVPTASPEQETQSEAIGGLLRTFHAQFREELPPSLPPSRNYEHSIDTGDAAPINLNAYPLSPIHIEEQSKQIATMLKQGLIRESASPWGFPVLFVKKPGGKWRMCIDFRALNAVTRKNGYPLPRIQESLDLIGSAQVLSKLDLTQGYYQIRVAADAVEKTAFNTREGKFEFLAMPFGLANAPATFQTLMNRILQPFLGKFVIVYLDDIVIYSPSMDEHIRHLTAVLEVLRANTLYAKPSKCVFAVAEIEFCGHMVGNGQSRPLASKVAAIIEWPTPTNVHEVRQFLGMVSYYRRFIREFAQIAVPLFELLKESDAELRKKKFRKVTWTASCENSFCELKRRLTENPVLRQPDTTRPFFLNADASEWAIGCELLQEDPETGRLHPVAYDGRKLTPAEINYPIHEKELLAIKYGLQTWRMYVDNGHTITVYTDHESLKYLATMRNPSKRLARWIDEFGEYDLNILYRSGAKQVIPDAISRRSDWMGDGPRNRASIVANLRSLDEDEWAKYMVDFLKSGTIPPQPYEDDIFAQSRSFAIDSEDNLLYIDSDGYPSPYLPQLFRADFLERMHSEYGHLGYPGLQGVVKGRGWWHDLEKDIRNYVHICPECQCSQRSRPNQETEAPQTLASTSIQLFDRWAIDLIGILPKTPAGNRWILTAIEYLTGWPVSVALKSSRAEVIAAALHDHITMIYGPFVELLSDNGPNLTGKVMRAYTKLMRTKHRYTTPYHPRTNGKLENFNGFLGSILTKMLVNQPTALWDQYLAQATFAARIRVHAGTQKSPYYLLFGRQPRITSDDNRIRPLAVTAEEIEANEDRLAKLQHARILANKLLVEKAIKAKKVRADKVKHVFLRKGDWVLVRAEARNKFEARWFGPYKINKAMPLGTYQLADPSGNIVRTLINGQRLVLAHVDKRQPAKLWSSSQVQGELRRKKIADLIEHSPEVDALFEEENDVTPSYDELASYTPKDWARFDRAAERSGDRSVEKGEGNEAAEQRSTTSHEDLRPLANTDETEREPFLASKSGARDAAAGAGTSSPPYEWSLPTSTVVDQRKEVLETSEIPFDIPAGSGDQEANDVMPVETLDERKGSQADVPTCMDDHAGDRPRDISMEDVEPNTAARERAESGGAMPGPLELVTVREDEAMIDIAEEGEPARVAMSSSPKAKRIPLWKRELAASYAPRERTDSPYALRRQRKRNPQI